MFSLETQKDANVEFKDVPRQYFGRTRYRAASIPQLDLEQMNLNSPKRKNLPGEPFVNQLQRTYKDQGNVPKEALEDLSTEGMKHLIEILINDNLNLQDQLALQEEKKTPTSVFSGSEDDYQRGTTNFSVATTYNNSYSKQPTFPQVSRPLAREELKMRRFNNISTYQKGSVWNFNDRITNPNLNVYETQLTKLAEEVNEAAARKSMLHKLFRLSPKKMQFMTHCHKVLQLFASHKKKIQDILAENSGLKVQLEIIQLIKKTNKNNESESKDYSMTSYHEGEANSFYTNQRVHTEIQILNSLREAYDSGNTKKFRELAYGLMGEYEASEITMILVKHAKYLEEEICCDYMKLAARRKEMFRSQQIMYQSISCQNEDIQEKISKLNQDIISHLGNC